MKETEETCFCTEPIIAAYEGSEETEGADAFFDCYHDLAYHVTAGYRIVLETTHYIISLGATGVSLSEKAGGNVYDCLAPGEELEPFVHTGFGLPPYEAYESTLFVGERLKKVEKANDLYILDFDHFQLKLIPHDPVKDDVPLPSIGFDTFNHVYGCERLINGKCECGGNGELLLDYVFDYVVRCKDCGKSTWASVTAIEAIKDWNAGEIHCDLHDITVD